MHRKALKGIKGTSRHYRHIMALQGEKKRKKEGITSHKEAYKGILKAYKGI